VLRARRNRLSSLVVVDFGRQLAERSARPEQGAPDWRPTALPAQQGTSTEVGASRRELNLTEQALAVRCRLMEARLPLLGGQMRKIERQQASGQLAPLQASALQVIPRPVSAMRVKRPGSSGALRLAPLMMPDAPL
jgi:hypothetical protein